MERRFPRVKMVLDNSLTLAEWEIHPETPGADPGRIMGQTLRRAGRAGLMALPVAGLRDDHGFEDARVDRIFNRRLTDRQPAAVVRPTTEDEVVRGVRLARERGWQVAVRSGGHSWAQWSVRADALVIDLGAPAASSRTTTPPASSTASPAVQGGAELAPYLEERGRFFPGGHCPTVGIGGFLLQGGQGWNARGWGWAAEYVEAVDVVTAAGELVRASARRERRPLLGRARRRAGLLRRRHPLPPAHAARARPPRADRARLRPRRLRRGDDLAARDPRARSPTPSRSSR